MSKTNDNAKRSHTPKSRKTDRSNEMLDDLRALRAFEKELTWRLFIKENVRALGNENKQHRFGGDRERPRDKPPVLTEKECKAHLVAAKKPVDDLLKNIGPNKLRRLKATVRELRQPFEGGSGHLFNHWSVKDLEMVHLLNDAGFVEYAGNLCGELGVIYRRSGAHECGFNPLWDVLEKRLGVAEYRDNE